MSVPCYSKLTYYYYYDVLEALARHLFDTIIAQRQEEEEKLRK
jgi:hypothetical protein